VATKVRFQEPLKTLAQEHDLLAAVFPVGSKRLVSDIDILDVECNERPKPDAGSQEEREHEVVPFGGGTSVVCEGFEQHFNLVIRKDDRRFSRASSQTNERRWVGSHVSCIGKKLKEGAKRGLRSIQRRDRFEVTPVCVGEVFRCQVAGDHPSGDVADFNRHADPLFKDAEVSHVDRSGQGTFSISLELGIKTAYGG
jgi:hypothetical protein